MESGTTTYIALLRGINIGGHRVKMEHLRELFRELELANARSYIQTGNIFFDTAESDHRVLDSRIEWHLSQALGYEVPIFLRTVPELEDALHPNPYEGVEVTPDTRLLVVFTSELLTCEQPLPLRFANGAVEILHITRSEVFVVYRLVNGRPPNVAAFLKRAFGRRSKTTSRFYETSLKILQAARGE